MEHLVNFRGFMPNEAIRSQISGADLLVLPSNEKEGWGAVISEALMVGVPVVCSHYCGASVLINNHELGRVFEAGNMTDLSEKLAEMVELGKPDRKMKEMIIKNYHSRMGVQSIIDYFTLVLEYITTKSSKPIRKPVAPWLTIVPNE